MKWQSFPRATSVNVSAIGRLLVIRAQHFEFGRDDFGRGFAINFTGSAFCVGDPERSGVAYWLTLPQAAAVALGQYAVSEVPSTCHIPVASFRYPATDEPWVPLTPRKPVARETRPARRERRAK